MFNVRKLFPLIIRNFEIKLFSDKAKVVFAPKEGELRGQELETEITSKLAVFFAFGHQAILDCHFRSNPPLTNLRWEKDGFLYDPYNVKDVFYKRNGSLFFSQADDLHAGKYTCTPYNELGTEGPSTIIKVIIQHPPGKDLHFT